MIINFIFLWFFSAVVTNMVTGSPKTGHYKSKHKTGIAMSFPNSQKENRTLTEIYHAALKEGGKLVVCAGGDFNGQQNQTKNAFMSKFPGIDLQMIVDFSKYHDARIDHQLATNSVVFDVAHLQTVQNFPRWKELGALLNYIPLDYERVRPEFKDPEGAYYGVQMHCISNNINTELLPNSSSWPTEARDYLRPEFKNKLIATYPNDDDAVLFLFKQIVDKYGIQYLHNFTTQNPVFVRGTHVGFREVAAGTYSATFTSTGPLAYTPGATRFVLPMADPFVLWPQFGAIFKGAPHPEAAKLYMSWHLSKEFQETVYSFSVRDDVPPPPGYGYRGVLEYPNGNPQAFIKFMSDRRAVETFRSTVSLIFGEVVGENPANSTGYGLHPIREP